MFFKIKGTKDYDKYDVALRDDIYNNFNNLIKIYNFKMIDTPIFEAAELFKRSNESSDMVRKEMYDFLDKGKRSICLRPEGTAPFIRALIENKWYVDQNKFAYFGPMFRYEQPQKGRYRQFIQAGIEYLSNKNPLYDVEVILMAKEIIEKYFDFDKEIELKINSIGDLETRQKYENDVYNFLLPHYEQLTQTSKERLNERKVLRILDDKIDSKHKFMNDCPKIIDYLSPSSRDYFDAICDKLKNQNIKFTVSTDLVRGLDYYDELVFEFVVKTEENELTVLGGGRYSKLINELGGPDISSIGFGLGVDRMMALIKDIHPEINEKLLNNVDSVEVFATTSTDNIENKNIIFELVNNLRKNNISVEFNPDEIKIKKIFNHAQKYNAKFLLFDDIKVENKILLKNLETKETYQLEKNDSILTNIINLLKNN